MRSRCAFAFALLLAALLGGGPNRAQTSSRATSADPLRAVAQRTGLPEEALAPVLASLARLEADRLPTERFVNRMVECIAKKATPEIVRTRAEKLERDIRQAKALLEQASSKGLPYPPTAPAEPDPVDEVADALQSSPLTALDLIRVMGYLKTDGLPRILAGADATAHLRRMGLEEGLIRKLLAASKPSLPDAELRSFPAALFTGRRCGKEDADIVSSLLRRMGSGGKPSELAKEWSASPSFRGGMPQNPNWSPGSGEGRSPRGGQGDGTRGNQGNQGGRGSGTGRRGGR